MSLVVRLSRTGKKGERKFRVVVQEKRSRREGLPIEMLGFYEMGPNGKKQVNMERYNYWLGQGAQPSETVKKVVDTK